MIILLITAALAIGQQSASDFDDFAEKLLERLIATKAIGIVQVVDGPDHMLMFSGTPPAGTEEFDVYRRLPGEGFRAYRRIVTVSADFLKPMPQENTGGTLRAGDLLMPRGSNPDLAVRLAPFENLGNAAAGMLERLIRIRLERSGLFRIEELQGVDDQETLVLANLSELRGQLRDRGIDVALNLLPMRTPNEITIVCQVISSAPDSDDLFSFSSVISPELTVLLQSDADEENILGSGGELLASAPLNKESLAIAAVDADDQEGDELAVLLPREVQLFRWVDGQLRLFSRISLDSIPDANYPTRMPSGRLFTADMDGDGKRELLVSSNLWANGCVIEFDGDAVVNMLAQQPIAVVGSAENLLFYSGTYRPGEDTYRDVVRILNNRGQTVRQSLFENLRSLHSLNDTGNRIIILHSNWSGSLWDRGREETLVTPLELGQVAALTAFQNITVFAQHGTGYAGSGREHEASSTGSDTIVRFMDFDGVNPEKTVHLTAALDILDITVYNPPGLPVRALAFLVKDNLGSISLELYSWPE